ncbi:MAG: helix-turn-helix domain-containing protein [Bacteroidia bacterium]|nr:helix-turn-helix domain-containing protein [Bacteroidia bacterium]MCF8426083.1 helix-turn-helix domain-containing protein [Bacteroidia bacterium]MCF8446348.1 helix-turn-helix domain-containing protein [Bacteroidia bacterium]
MSSKIEVLRICEQCNKEFTARTTVTRFCSHKCASTAHKQKLRNGKIEESNIQTKQVRNQPIEELKAKEFLTVREVARLLNCSIRSVYYYIDDGSIKAVNLGQRITRVKRSEIDKLFEQPKPLISQAEQKELNISDCYNLSEIQIKFGVSEKALHDIIKRNTIPKIRKGKFAYVPKTEIDKILN